MKVGDFVEIGGIKGTVREIQIFNTLIDTPDNVRAIIPNAKVTGDYWGVYFDVTQKVKESLDENGISIPYPQRDVHMINAETS